MSQKGLKMTYQEDRIRADKHLPQIKKILKGNFAFILDVKHSSEEKDKKESVDLIAILENQSVINIAVRIREPECEYRDLTIRAERNSGVETELSKIKKGFGRWYFYAWVNKWNEIDEWMIVDLDKLREKGLLEKERPLISNNDGTYFIQISRGELRENYCLVSEN